MESKTCQSCYAFKVNHSAGVCQKFKRPEGLSRFTGWPKVELKACCSEFRPAGTMPVKVEIIPKTAIITCPPAVVSDFGVTVRKTGKTYGGRPESNLGFRR
ncbi:MAG: hypothetical protein HQK57_02255 [Deltaproteobacteria bacterium]|nr:hypothetical protein [Deltaproteobacteria bacterium]